jgi:hypothetical protein
MRAVAMEAQRDLSDDAKREGVTRRHRGTTAGRVPVIHVLWSVRRKTWMA